jgi:hypothetical protein
MTDPIRLHEDETNSLDALLLRAGRDYAPPGARLRRIAAGIASAGATISGPTFAAASSAAAGAGAGVKASGTALGIVLKWLGIGALSGLTLSATATVIQTNGPAPGVLAPERGSRPIAIETQTTVSPVARAQTLRAPVTAEQQASLGARPQERSGERAPADRTPPNRPPIPARTPAATPYPETGGQGAAAPVSEPQMQTTTESQSRATAAALREEVAALGLAKAALDRGAAEEVRALVSAYRVRFPRGRLGPEATYLEMEAELLRGNTGRAQSLALELATVASPNAKRVREVLKGDVR